MLDDIKEILVTPSASKLIENLTHIGYSFPDSVADIIDNSIQANSDEIYIDICQLKNNAPPYIVVCDNGVGMNRKQLINAMTFGSDIEYSNKDLGKFGLGLKTASLSQCRILTVVSRPRSNPQSKSRLNICRWDMTQVYANDEWKILNPSIKELDKYEHNILDRYEAKIKNGGTLIIWSDMKEFFPGLYSRIAKEREDAITNLIEPLKDKLGLAFHRFIDGSVSGKKKIKIFFDNKEIKGIDPFCTKEKIQQLDKKIISMKYGKEQGRSQVTLSPYILPRDDQFSSRESYNEASKLGTWLSSQGLYFYRNGRLLKYGGWSSCATKDRKNILLRVAVDFNSKLDLGFQVNISKAKASIPKEIKRDVEKNLQIWITKSRKRWHGKHERDQEKTIKVAHKETALSKFLEFKIIKNGSKILCKRSPKDKKIIINIPSSHFLSEFLEKKQGRGNGFKDLSYQLLSIIDVIKNKKLKAEHIPLDEIYEITKEIK